MATNKMAMYYHMQMFLCWGKTSGQSKCFILVLMSQICITTSTFENSSAFTPIQNPKWRRHNPLNGPTRELSIVLCVYLLLYVLYVSSGMATSCVVIVP